MPERAVGLQQREQGTGAPDLADFIDSNRERLCDLWKEQARSRYSPDLDDSQLLDHLPSFVDEIAEALRSRGWPSMETAAKHGRERVKQGTDIGMLVGELALLGEVITALALEEGREVTSREASLLIRALGNGIACSAQAYAEGRDRELAEQASRNFSFIAHELRSPLHVAKLALTVLQQGRGDSSEPQLLRLARSLSSLSELIDNALVEARLDNEPALRLQRTTAETLIDGALEHVAPFAQEIGVDLALEVEPFDLEVDPKLMISALANLVSNAVKFTEQGTTVAVRARPEDGQAIFEVEDRCGGLGADPERLFEPFVQGDGDSSGFGLGLMIVRRAVEAHGGQVRVTNRPSRGCTFAVDLPLHGGGAREG